MIQDIKPGQTIVEFFILRKKEMRKKKNGNVFLSVELGDATGRIFGSYWKNAERAYEALKEGKPLKVQATVIAWKGKIHLSIQKIRPAEVKDNINPADFIPKTEHNIQEQFAELEKLITNVENKELKSLLTKFYKDDEFKNRLLRTPGGKLWHHCYEGGLLEHTLRVAKIVINIVEHYSNLNMDLLIAGALLHDIGKLYEFENRGFFDYSDQGRLHGHIAIGYHLVASEIDKMKMDEETKNHLLHLILSHQGQKEFGSPTVPMSREAFILYFADELDSKMGAFDRIQSREKEPGKKWSNYVRLLDRFLYFGEDG